MRELRYLSSTFFFIIIAFILYLAYLYVKPYISIIVFVVVTVSLASFIVLMGSVSLSVWRAFSTSGKIEEMRAGIKKRIPRTRKND